ncbi:hypothetical protein E3J84_00325 [Candidatus Aerophobetes bacterium]|uniref:DUF5678 domain-containing protein n=1 Tax=Aerophobetes bacterium TaxID=2030807 RepID=A0A523S5B5_UNCAE|nr:MAG: hypothetical protein E3J84_00325 [Candidatus Aerophobetes bacterium]
MMTLKLVESRPATEEEKKRVQEVTADSNWLSHHAAEIWEKYKGKYIAVVEQTLFVGDTWEEAISKAKEKCPEREPLVKHIPYKRRIWVL